MSLKPRGRVQGREQCMYSNVVHTNARILGADGYAGWIREGNLFRQAFPTCPKGNGFNTAETNIAENKLAR